MSTANLAEGVDTSFIWKQFETMGIDPEKDVNEFERFQCSLFDWADFAEYWFRDPMDESRPLRLDAPQKSAIRAIQFGYDIYAYPWIIPAEKRPKEIVMIWPRQFGKTTAVAVAAAAAFIFMNRRFPIGTFSINQDGAINLMKRIKYFIRSSPFANLIESQNMTTITKLGEKVTCTAYPASEGVRGRSLALGLIDEAATIPEDILHGVILYTLRRAGIRWIMLSTPKGYKGEFIKHFKIGMATRPICCKSCQAMFDQDSPLFRQYAAKFNTYWIPHGLPPCPNCGNTTWIYGIGEYTIVPVDPWTCSWKTREEIQHELDLAGNTPLARQEILGEIILEGANVFTRAMLERSMDSKLLNIPRPNYSIKNYTMGMDFGKTHDASVMNVGHYDWKINKCVWDYMLTIAGEYQNIDYVDIRRQFLELVALYNPVWVVPDATGVGDSVVDDMWNDIQMLRIRGYVVIEYVENGKVKQHVIKMARGQRCRTKIYCNKKEKGQFSKRKRKGFIFDINTKMDVIDNLLEGYTKRADLLIPGYNVPEVKDFWDEMLAFGFEVTDSKHIKYGTQSAHDDRVIAHALMYWASRQRPFVSCESKLG
jgi:hypothetical protein